MHEDVAGSDAAGEPVVDGLAAPVGEITIDDEGTWATLAVGAGSAPPPKLHPAQATSAAAASTAGRKTARHRRPGRGAAGNARLGVVSVTAVMLRRTSGDARGNRQARHLARRPLTATRHRHDLNRPDFTIGGRAAPPGRLF